ncbi:hypothetical protein AMAG_01443 [Allomyces macrogynus ATCC 38327]|uniref:Cyclic nucleotide-binding domain-containing protein n=1 Tax=Allomyces macrogynus (strain ATCC 38327) TaxID=578462 RepID=A0A0L0RZ01_ALLM3|nr:hypothetical protein AMAG_01443 [Allomyces macrogynus ATCC 38327]|eukprot:KNE55553.1 hypothetical protein AMAG_01443 [Allomyces macrogynus ATCC 38327]
MSLSRYASPRPVAGAARVPSTAPPPTTTATAPNPDAAMCASQLAPMVTVPALVRSNSTPAAGGALLPMVAPPSPSTTLSHETFGSVLESFASLVPPPQEGTNTGHAVQGDANALDGAALPSPSPARSREPSPRPTPVVSIDRAPRPPANAAAPPLGGGGEAVAFDFLGQRRSSGGDAAAAASAASAAAAAASNNDLIADAAHDVVSSAALTVPSLGGNAAVRRNPSRHLMLVAVSDVLGTVDEEDAAATADAPSTPPSSSSQLPALPQDANPPPRAQTAELTLPRSITAGVAAAVSPTTSAAYLPAHQAMVPNAILPFAPADPTTGSQPAATSGGADLGSRRASRASASKAPITDARGEPGPVVSTTWLAPDDLAGNGIPPSLANASGMEDVEGDPGEMSALNEWARAAQEWYRDTTDMILRTVYRRFHDSWENTKSNPHALFWRWWDVAIRTIHVLMLFLIPITASFKCDYLPSYVIRWFVLDLILILSTLLDVVRPKVDEYGIIVTEAREKRQLFMSDWVNWAKLVACIPFDWPIVVMWANNDSPLLECSGAISVLTDGSIAPPATTAPVEQRFMYHAHEIPVALTVYTCVRWLRLLHTTSTMFWYSAVRVPGISHLVGRLIKCLCFSFVVSNLNASVFWTLEAHCGDTNRYIERYLVDADSANPTAPTAFDYRFWRNLFEAQKSLFFIPREVRATIEVKYQTFEMLAAVLIYGALFGNLAAIVRSFDSQAGFEKAAKERLARRTYLRSYLIQYRFPRELQRKLLTQEEKDWAHKKGGDADGLFKSWPKSLRAEVFTHLYLDLIAKVPLFADTDHAFRVALAERITTITVQSGFYICKAGESGSECYFIRDGAVEILPPDESKVLVTLHAGGFFGEIALLEPDSRRTATAKTVRDTTLCVLRKQDFNQILTEYPAMVDRFQQLLAERKAADAKRKAEAAERGAHGK